jgi:hypothetical protein
MEWVVVYKTNKMFDAELCKTKVEHHNIPAVIVSKQDSSYLAFGYIEVHVPADYREEALTIIQEQE